MSDVGTWFKSLPVFTRYWLALTIAFSIIGRFKIISISNLVLLYDPFIRNFELWRGLTSLFFYPASFHLLMNLYFLYNYSLRLERIDFDGRPADYFFLLIFNWICCLVAGLLLNFTLLMNSMIVSVIYVWCQLNKDAIVQFWFGLQFKAMYLPWVLFGINFIINHDGLEELIGILCGHLYFFLKFKYPQEFGGPSLLSTPSILEYYFPQRSNIRGFGAAPTAQPSTNSPFGHSWGRGQVLGQ
ncbi:derlin-1 [Copidosoma floridanum]|uniref:derlin-1 n=1 Tax=Copidosoma floridanum TaxID=29053 RepID=UPI0006C9DE6B|nr:derlin-1 [Copidosoma floridanum]